MRAYNAFTMYECQSLAYVMAERIRAESVFNENVIWICEMAYEIR